MKTIGVLNVLWLYACFLFFFSLYVYVFYHFPCLQVRSCEMWNFKIDCLSQRKSFVDTLVVAQDVVKS